MGGLRLQDCPLLGRILACEDSSGVAGSTSIVPMPFPADCCSSPPATSTPTTPLSATARSPTSSANPPRPEGKFLEVHGGDALRSCAALRATGGGPLSRARR